MTLALENHTQCDHCCNYFKNEEITEINDIDLGLINLCNECSEKMLQCDICKHYTLEDETIRHGEAILCQHCGN
ncbi:MAG: hypothetical protein BWY21_00311 [Parcubacteria group bacterium ADurb.Bin216]|nr:MAG: hypothetical protein BWY21_00311 [Parcubacteria group bacterium ADurb.Bin216]